jgi:hypothetical protein
MKGVQHMCGRERNHAGLVRPPASVEQHSSFAAETCVHVGAAKVRAHNFIWHCGIPNAHMGNLALSKRFMVFRAQNRLPGVVSDNVRFR